MDIHYELTADNAVNIFYGKSKVPGIYQPFDPADETGQPFTAAKAKAWAEDYIKTITAANAAAAAASEESVAE